MIFHVMNGNFTRQAASVAVAERLGLAGEGRRQQRLAAFRLVDAQPHGSSGRQDAEMIARAHVDEGRDVEDLGARLAHAGFASARPA